MNFYYLCIELVFSYHLKDDRTCFFSMYCNEEDLLKGLFTSGWNTKIAPIVKGGGTKKPYIFRKIKCILAKKLLSKPKYFFIHH